MHINWSVKRMSIVRLYSFIIGGDGKRTHARTSSNVERGIKC